LQERTVEHQPTKIVGNKPITIGQGFGTLAWIPEEVGRIRRALGLRLGPKAQSSRWALPLLHERTTSAETPIEKGSSQLRRVCEKLPVRPISLWDSEYGNAAFVNESADIPADKIIRLRPNICLGAHYRRTRDEAGRGSMGARLPLSALR